jgi:hypothetical protein
LRGGPPTILKRCAIDGAFPLREPRPALRYPSIVAVVGLALASACGGGAGKPDTGILSIETPDGAAGSSAPDGRDGGDPGDVAKVDDAASTDGPAPGDGAAPDAAGGAPTAEALLALTRHCTTVVSDHPYATDDDAVKNIDICGLPGAVFWTADMDIDCDGRNVGDGKCPGDDCCYQPATAFTTKAGRPLAASVTPYVVIPTDFRPDGLAGGAVVAVIAGGKVQYAVFGDTGPDTIIGEASYACAAALGIDPDPATGGTDGPVTYIAFLGSDAIPPDIEDQAATRQLGERLAAALLLGH